MINNWFISPKFRPRSHLVLFTFILAFIVIALGAYTRLTDAGLSCPDWPNCYGYLTAPHTDSQLKNAALLYPFHPVNIKKAWTEMTHRYFAGTEGILILILSCSILFSRRAKDLKSVSLATGLIIFTFLQVALGMLTVTAKLKPMIVLAHLVIGISLLSILWWAYLDIYLRFPLALIPSPLRHEGCKDLFITVKRFIPWIRLGLILIFAQIILGGWVSSHYAGLACVDFPYCNGQILPSMQWSHLNSDLITIHMLHRIGALITGLYLGGLSLVLFFTPSFRHLAISMMTLIILQMTLGILNIIWLRPLFIALIHQTVAILLLLTIITVLVKATLAREYRYGPSIK